jgi:hypothetical protein
VSPSHAQRACERESGEESVWTREGVEERVWGRERVDERGCGREGVGKRACERESGEERMWAREGVEERACGFGRGVSCACVGCACTHCCWSSAGTASGPRAVSSFGLCRKSCGLRGVAAVACEAEEEEGVEPRGVGVGSTMPSSMPDESACERWV